MLSTLFQTWSFSRILRLVLAIGAGIQAWQLSDPMLGLMAGLIGLMAFTNTGCCGGGSCQLPPR
jgi:hypothetical protein